MLFFYFFSNSVCFLTNIWSLMYGFSLVTIKSHTSYSPGHPIVKFFNAYLFSFYWTSFPLLFSRLFLVVHSLYMSICLFSLFAPLYLHFSLAIARIPNISSNSHFNCSQFVFISFWNLPTFSYTYIVGSYIN